MEEFEICISKTITSMVTIEAKTEEEACEKALKMVENEEVSFDSKPFYYID